MIRPVTPLRARAFTLWANARAARRLLARGDAEGYRACLDMVSAVARLPGPATLRRCASSTRDSLTAGPEGQPAIGPPRASRDVPPGTSWAFNHRPLSAIPPGGNPDHDPPPAAA